MKYPIGIQTFDYIREGGFAYVDKTGMVYRLAHEGKAYFLSRPRRFGKSLLLSTLSAYFRGRRELFRGLALDSLETEWPAHAVLHVDLGGADYTQPGALEAKLANYLSKWEKEYGLCPVNDMLSERFINVIDAAYERTGRGVVVLIDEYDKPLLDVLGGTPSDGLADLETRHRNTLRGFYSVLKSSDRHLRLVFLTGVTKFAQVSVFSGLNNLEDISMSEEYDTICGITPAELRSSFSAEVGELAARRGWSPDEAWDRLRRSYDGYHFSEALSDVYNPFSLLNALKSKRIDDYWFQTGTPTYLVRLMRGSDVHLDELTGRYYSKDEFEDYRADRERPLPMIFQSGYLTIKGYEGDTGSYKLDLPNDEVRRGFLRLLADDYLGPRPGADPTVKQLYRSLSAGDFDSFRETLTEFLASIPYTMRRKGTERERERYFQYTFYLVLRLLSTYAVGVEVEQSRGRVDCVVRAADDVYVIEFKLDGGAREALAQIESRGYARPYASLGPRLHKVGVSFSSETGTIEEWEEE